MVQQFRKSVPFCKLFREAALYETSPGQALGDYCFQKLDKLRKLDIRIPDKYLIDMVIGGVTDVNVARTIRSVQHMEVNALYAYMTTLGSMPVKAGKYSVISKYHDKDGRRDQVRDSLQSKQPRTTSERNISSDKSAISNIKEQIQCFNCEILGHTARKCRKP